MRDLVFALYRGPGCRAVHHHPNEWGYRLFQHLGLDDCGWLVGTVVFMAASVVAVCMIVFNFVPNAIQAKVAPRVLLVEKAADLAGLNKGK